ncbi:MAG: response regulator [Desulfomonilaceae bacterium]|nr:response regulator [Desulfomonilaceae bacterium]
MEPGGIGGKPPGWILVVEDSLTQAMLLQHFLEESGYRVLRAASGTEAIGLLETGTPALIISDIVMPGMDGFELTRKIKCDAKLKRIPVILLTALSDPQDVIRGLEAEVDFYITKPYDKDFLLSKVDSVIANPLRKANGRETLPLQISIWGQIHSVDVDPEHALSFLASTYENAIQINQELQKEITERKRIEGELRITVERLKQMESIIEISPAVAFVRRASDNWPIEFVSDNVLQFDYESEDLLAGEITYGDIIHPDDRARVFAEVLACAKDPDIEEFSLEYRILTGYGEQRWVDDRTFVRRDSKGVVTHLQGIILDVTHRMNGG